MTIKTIRSLVLVLLPTLFFAQDAIKAQKSPRAQVTQRINKTDITVVYHRPATKGREIWGKLVPFGMSEDKKGNKFPWRAGANENTTVTFSTDVKINKTLVPAGTYGLHMIIGEKESSFIINKKNDAWGSFSYNKNDDVIRVKVKNQANAQTEWLSYSIEPIDMKSAEFSMAWEKQKFSFDIKVD